MRQDRRAPFATALEAARRRGYPAGEYVGQESFMPASHIRELARRAGIRAGSSVLDLCCGVAGPGRLITAEFGCRYLGVDCSAGAVRIARERAGHLPCRFLRARVPPLPAGRVEVVLLLETLLAFPDKADLLTQVARALEPGGRFACTVEEGRPLSAAEQHRMPRADTVWPIEWAELDTLLTRASLELTWSQDCTAAHQAIAAGLLGAYRADAADISQQVGPRAAEELIRSHQLWSDWLASGRIRKFALVARRP